MEEFFTFYVDEKKTGKKNEKVYAWVTLNPARDKQFCTHPW